jgi:hypothetical protein
MRMLGSRRQGMVHRGEIVVGRIQMRAVMRAQRARLDSGIFALRQLIDADAEIAGDRRRGHVVVAVLDLRQSVRRVAGDTRLQGDGDIDEAAGHQWSFDCA